MSGRDIIRAITLTGMVMVAVTTAMAATTATVITAGKFIA
jgi:hypothetical protein